MLFLYPPHPTTHPQTTHNSTKSIIETYDTNDFTEHETVSDNEIALPFKPLTTRKKEGDTHEGKVVLGDDIYHFSLKAIEENRASKTYIGIALVAIGLCVVALLA